MKPLQDIAGAMQDAAPWLANHLWQSTVFAAVAGLLTLVLRNNHARARHWIWMAASVKFLIPFALLAGLASHFARPKAVAATQPAAYFVVEDFSEPFASAIAPVAAPVATMSRAEALALAGGAMWLGGFLVVLGLWCVRWRRAAAAIREAAPLGEGREVEALRRIETAGEIRGRVELRLSAGAMEPGVFGFGFGKTPTVLAWPMGVSERLDDVHLEAILAHEVCHVRRRDNLTAAVHMFVEAAFWFHPLVWWMGARLVEERERACDEAVLELCARPEAYAEGILKVCEFCVQTPLECVSGVTGADLKKRIVAIMTQRVVRKLDVGRKLLLAAVGLAVVAVPFVLGQAKSARRMMLAAVDAAPRPFRVAAHAMIALEETPSAGLIAEEQADGQTLPPPKQSLDGAPDARAGQAPGVYKVWLDQDVRWIISPEESAAFLRLTNDEERDRFIEQFWERRNPTRGAAENAFRDEHYARIAYANQHFASGQPGWMTDRGHAYIVYGKPDEVDAHPGSGTEAWHYRSIPGVGDNVVLTFVDASGTGDYHLLKPLPQARVAPAMKFDVASIRPSRPDEGWMSTPQGTPEDFKANMCTVESMIGFAYDIPYSQVMTSNPKYAYNPHSPNLLGGPQWVSSDQFDLKAKADEATMAAWSKLPPKEQREMLRGMMRTLLADRFQLVMRHETREMPVWELVVAKGGPKITPLTGPPPVFNDGSDPAKPYQSPWDGGDLGAIVGRSVTISGVAEVLWGKREMESRKVLDHTGLTGRYDIRLKWASVDDPGDGSGPSLFTAIEEQLGLKLVPTKAPMDVLVIDSIQRPSEN